MTARMSRSRWTDTPPQAPALLVPSHVVGLAVHWDGPPVPVAVNDATDPAKVATFLRAVLRFHTATRGWSDIAYQWAADQAGRRWELRGWARQSAANGDQDVNQRWGAVVALIGEGQTPTPALLAALADCRRDFRRHYPHATALVCHADVRPDPTACPGPDLTRWVRAGGPDPREDDMSPQEMIDALTDELRRPDGKLGLVLRNQVRIAVDAELTQRGLGEQDTAPPTS